ncbi:MAG: hypothetical protein Tsb0020_18040 [Haliangiales bacterium]
MPDKTPDKLVALAPAAGPDHDRDPSSPLSQFQPESSDPDRRPWNLLTRDCEAAVGMSPDGDILFSHGDADDLADVTALAARLAQLTAKALGMEEMIAMECSSERESFFIYRATTGEQVALKPRAEVSLRSIKAALDL